MKYAKIIQKVKKKFGVDVTVTVDERSIFLQGQCDNWSNIVAIGKLFVDKTGKRHVVNDISLVGHIEETPILPAISDNVLDSTSWDVVVIGGGISGCAVARELTKYNLKVLLCEKHSDVAHGASGANDGMVHPGIDIKHNCKKLHYVTRGNDLYPQVCDDLGVEFARVPQYVVFTSRIVKFFARSYLKRARKHKILGVKMIGKKKICQLVPTLKDVAVGALTLPTTGAVSPYKLTIAYAENAVANGATISLDTAVLSIEKQDELVTSLVTNRGTVSAKCVINCAGVFADKIAQMADDRYFSIHPRKGTDLLLDPNTPGVPNCGVKVVPALFAYLKEKNTKGGGVVKTIDGNILMGPNAQEVASREDTSTDQASVDEVFNKQRASCPTVDKSSIIAYFSGVRAPTYEEDFIIERSAKVHNLIHVAGIQSPGLTCAPAFAIDVAELAVEYLRSSGVDVQANQSFNPVREKPVCIKDLSEEQLNQLIQQNGDYGKIVCRCEQISLGEIKQAINNPLGVATVDGVKRRVRAGMGRCQGGFCMPQIVKIIAEQKGVDYQQVNKGDVGSYLASGKLKES